MTGDEGRGEVPLAGGADWGVRRGLAAGAAGRHGWSVLPVASYLASHVR